MDKQASTRTYTVINNPHSTILTLVLCLVLVLKQEWARDPMFGERISERLSPRGKMSRVYHLRKRQVKGRDLNHQYSFGPTFPSRLTKRHLLTGNSGNSCFCQGTPSLPEGPRIILRIFNLEQTPPA